MSPLAALRRSSRDERGYTLVELLVAMVIGLIITLAAFDLLEFSSRDVSRITDRAHVSQTARVALERLMLELHSACVAATVTPIVPGSTTSAIRFISESSPLNVYSEPTSALATVRLHEVIFTPAAGEVQGTLVEKSWPSYGNAPHYKFNNSTEAPTTRLLLTGIAQSVDEQTSTTVPVFQYYRYYRSSDGSEAKLGQLDPVSFPPASEKEAEQVAKVTIAFTLAPEGTESATFNRDRPVAFEDSAVFRLAPSSESSGNPNRPCT